MPRWSARATGALPGFHSLRCNSCPAACITSVCACSLCCQAPADNLICIYRRSDHAVHDALRQYCSCQSLQATLANGEDGADDEEAKARKARTLQKVEEIKASMERKRHARSKYEAYVKDNTQAGGTDYEAWDLWCPEDEEDEMIATCTPQNAQLQAMEKDINERHEKCAPFLQFQMPAAMLSSGATP